MGIKAEKLKVSLEKNDFQRIIERYHYKPEEGQRIFALYERMEKEVEAKAYLKISGKEENKEAMVLVTLGKDLDVLQEKYSKEEKIWEEYAIECLSMELLWKAYEQVEEKIYILCGQWSGNYGFYGDQIPLEQIKEALLSMEQEEVSCNGAGALTPKKSVLYGIQLTEKCENSGRDLCSRC
ncbi:MAG: hypothetical protein RSJ40_09215, partial [Acetivibrio sp.]